MLYRVLVASATLLLIVVLGTAAGPACSSNSGPAPAPEPFESCLSLAGTITFQPGGGLSENECVYREGNWFRCTKGHLIREVSADPSVACAGSPDAHHCVYEENSGYAVALKKDECVRQGSNSTSCIGAGQYQFHTNQNDGCITPQNAPQDLPFQGCLSLSGTNTFIHGHGIDEGQCVFHDGLWYRCRQGMLLAAATAAMLSPCEAAMNNFSCIVGEGSDTIAFRVGECVNTQNGSLRCLGIGGFQSLDSASSECIDTY